MKNFKLLILFFLSLSVLSCSKDDGPKKEYFPTKITTNFASNPDLTTTTSIEYDDKNRISKFKYENANRTDSYEVVYDSDNLISLVKFKKVDSGTTTTKSLLYTYLNSYLQKLEILSSSGVETINFSFNVATGFYTTDRSVFDKFIIDENNNVLGYEFNSYPSYIIYNDNKGVYNNSNSLILIISSCSSYTSGYNLTHFSSLFFSNKEIIEVNNGDRIGTIYFDLITTRSSNNTISNIDYVKQSDGEIFNSVAIEYEKRTIN